VTRYEADRDGVIHEEFVGDPAVVAPVPPSAQPMVAPAVAGAVAPVAGEPTVVQPAVVQQPVQPIQLVGQPVQAVQPAAAVAAVQPLPTSGVVRRRFWQFDAAAVITAIAGVVLLLIGLIVIARAGLDPLTGESVEVLGFTHTPLLGVIEAAAGLLLLLAGVTKSREGAMFLATVIGIAAFVGAVQAESFERQLAIEEEFAWILVAAAVLVLLANLLIPRFSSRSTVYAAR
jgi:lysylphosphatidylglycerol synthetase-like protein (DUF2156 family)